jgi:hypothetical protein
MKNMICFSFALFILSVVLFSCKKRGCTDPNSLSYDKDATEDNGSCWYGGLGGRTTIVAFPQHHGRTISSIQGHLDSAFVKFNAQDKPSDGIYDLAIAGDSGEDHVHIEDLKPGKYYIFMTGYDTSISKYVFGGIPYTLQQTSGEIDANFPVTEGD